MDMRIYFKDEVCITWIIHVWNDSWFTRKMSRQCVTWLTHMYKMINLYATCSEYRSQRWGVYDMTHARLKWLGVTCVTWLIHTCKMICQSATCSQDCSQRWGVCGRTYPFVTWLTCVWYDSSVCDMTHSHSWHAAFTWDVTHVYRTWLLYVERDSCIWDVARVYATWDMYMERVSCIWDVTHVYGTWRMYMGRDAFHMWRSIWAHPKMRCVWFIWDVTRVHGTWLIHMGRDSSYRSWGMSMRRDSFIWDVTHSHGMWLVYMGRDFCIWHGARALWWLCLTWLNQVCDMTRAYRTWLI